MDNVCSDGGEGKRLGFSHVLALEMGHFSSKSTFNPEITTSSDKEPASMKCYECCRKWIEIESRYFAYSSWQCRGKKLAEQSQNASVIQGRIFQLHINSPLTRSLLHVQRLWIWIFREQIHGLPVCPRRHSPQTLTKLKRTERQHPHVPIAPCQHPTNTLLAHT